MTTNSTRQFARNASALSFTSGLRILLNLALRFAILRYLGVVGFGQYSIFLAYTTVFQTVAELGLPRLVIRNAARQRDQTSDYWWLSVAAQSMGALLSGGIMALLAVSLGYSIETKTLLLLGALSLLPYTVQSATEACCQALERMAFIPLVQGAGVVLQVTASLIVLAQGRGIMALGVIALVTQVLMAAFYLGVAQRLGLLHMRLAWSDLPRQATQLVRSSPEFFALAVSNVTFSKLDTLTLSRLLGDGPTGIYNTAFLVVQVFNLLLVGYTDALYPRLARLYQANRSQFYVTLNQALHLSLLAVIPVTLALSLLAAPIMAILHQGSLHTDLTEQSQAAMTLRILSWFALPFLINAILGGALMATGHQRASLHVSLTKLAAATVFYGIGIHFLGMIGAGIATLLTGLLAIGLNAFYIARAHGFVQWVHLLIKPALASLVMASVMIALSWPLGNPGWIALLPEWNDLLMIGLAGAVVYPVALIIFGGLTPADRSLARALVGGQARIEKVTQL